MCYKNSSEGTLSVHKPAKLPQESIWCFGLGTLLASGFRLYIQLVEFSGSHCKLRQCIGIPRPLPSFPVIANGVYIKAIGRHEPVVSFFDNLDLLIP